MARIPDGEPGERIIRALFWTLVYHLEPEKWDELARHEPIHPDLVCPLPLEKKKSIDVGAGSGRLTDQPAARSSPTFAVERSAGPCALLSRPRPTPRGGGGSEEH